MHPKKASNPTPSEKNKQKTTKSPKTKQQQPKINNKPTPYPPKKKIPLRAKFTFHQPECLAFPNNQIHTQCQIKPQFQPKLAQNILPSSPQLNIVINVWCRLCFCSKQMGAVWAPGISLSISSPQVLHYFEARHSEKAVKENVAISGLHSWCVLFVKMSQNNFLWKHSSFFISLLSKAF